MTSLDTYYGKDISHLTCLIQNITHFIEKALFVNVHFSDSLSIYFSHFSSFICNVKSYFCFELDVRFFRYKDFESPISFIFLFHLSLNLNLLVLKSILIANLCCFSPIKKARVEIDENFKILTCGDGFFSPPVGKMMYLW